MIAKKTHARTVVYTIVAFSILGAIIGYILLTKDSTETKESQMYAVLAAQTSMPLYTTKDIEKYRFVNASVADETIVMATYHTDKGIINVTHQPKPATDPFPRNLEPVDKFATAIGEARLFPDDKQEPYLVVSTALTWVIIRSTSEAVTSSDLKAFALSLQTGNIGQ